MATIACNSLFLVSCLVALLSLLAPGSISITGLTSGGGYFVECQEQLVVESRQEKEKELTAIINRLEELDHYYSQMARPRFGRSGDYSRPHAAASRYNGAVSPAIQQERSLFRAASQDPQRIESLLELLNGGVDKSKFN